MKKIRHQIVNLEPLILSDYKCIVLVAFRPRYGQSYHFRCGSVELGSNTDFGKFILTIRGLKSSVEGYEVGQNLSSAKLKVHQLH